MTDDNASPLVLITLSPELLSSSPTTTVTYLFSRPPIFLFCRYSDLFINTYGVGPLCPGDLLVLK